MPSSAAALPPLRRSEVGGADDDCGPPYCATLVSAAAAAAAGDGARQRMYALAWHCGGWSYAVRAAAVDGELAAGRSVVCAAP
eukprot:gene29291-2424_t